ncbi:hypothetical protein GDO81_026843 [Engystomops pustulosus]|uniref:Uncharacterized protein n=1 Tax=Engystomops pustulosus TaxID=76066 RepID=A0AAV6YHS2_ENGPU|nr:hypothetical protein GDO81_026843 [Engystomops pustulosus]
MVLCSEDCDLSEPLNHRLNMGLCAGKCRDSSRNISLGIYGGSSPRERLGTFIGMGDGSSLYGSRTKPGDWAENFITRYKQNVCSHESPLSITPAGRSLMNPKSIVGRSCAELQ